MKRLFFIAMASVALLLFSCKKDNNSSLDITGIWQVDAIVENGQSRAIEDCYSKTVFVFAENQATIHKFEKDKKNPSFCKYEKDVKTYRIEGDVLNFNDVFRSFSLSGNTLTLTEKKNSGEVVLKLKKINQTQLTAILATINNSNNNGSNNNNGSGSNNGGNTPTLNADGIWMLLSITENDVIETLDNCTSKNSIKISGNQITNYFFGIKGSVCSYDAETKTFTTLDNNTIELDGKRITISITNDVLTAIVVKNRIRTITKYKKINQAQLDALLQ